MKTVPKTPVQPVAMATHKLGKVTPTMKSGGGESTRSRATAGGRICRK